MKFTLSWLKDHLDTKVDLEIIIETLTNLGLEVESLQDRSKDLEPFKVAKVLKSSKHPDADKLKVCEVQTRDGIYQVVCGAPNAKTDMMAVFAPENTFIPGTKLKLKKTNIRGIESCGMLVSEKEMGISDEHDGIIEIDKKYKVGDSFSEIYGLNDPIIEINITPNRSDCLSVRGIARDLAAAGLGKLKNLDIKKIKPTFISPIKWRRNFPKEKEILCPGVSGRFFKNIKNGDSPDWLKKRLVAIGLRPISKLVDITNYITFDLGRPLHVYDSDKLNGDLTMCLAKDNQNCKTLDEKEYNLTSDMVVISDDKKLHGIGGVMGGLESGCSLKTTNVFLEVALFDPISVTKTGRKLNLQSDARYRFERGVDNTSIVWGVEKASEMIVELCGGEVSEITSDIGFLDKQKIIKYDFNKTKTLGGIEIDIEKQKNILENLGFEIKDNNLIKVPNFRPDIDDVSDLVEEIVRVYGYEKIIPISLNKETEINKETLNENLKTFYKAKKILANRGYIETITWSFISSKEYNNENNNKTVKIKNPISSDLNIMRPSIFPNLLKSVNHNINKLYTNGRLFEVGPQFSGTEEKDQRMVATGIQYGSINVENWNEDKRKSDIFDAKSDVYYVLDQLNVPIKKLNFSSTDSKYYHPGKSAQLKIGNNVLAQFGEMHPFVLNKFEIKTNINGFEIFLDNLSKFQIKKSSTKKSFNNNTFQIIERDFAFIFPKKIRAYEIIHEVEQNNKEFIKEVKIFDVFEGNKLPNNMKSLALKVILQPIEKTFTDKEIENISNNIIDLISKKFEGKLRQ